MMLDSKMKLNSKMMLDSKMKLNSKTMTLDSTMLTLVLIMPTLDSKYCVDWIWQGF